MTEQQLRDAVVAAITEDGLKPRAERVGLVEAMLAAVRPELDRLREVETIHRDLTSGTHPLVSCVHGHTTVHVSALAKQIAEKRTALAQRSEACREVDRLRAELAQHRDRVLTEAAEELERIADATEAKVAEHYGPASGIGPGSADMVREAARTVRGLAARTTETVHACPPGNSSLTPCCGRTPFELSRTDRLTYDQDQITCPAARTAQ